MVRRNGGDAGTNDRIASWSTSVVPMLDQQLTELIETVWWCERAWNQEDRIDAAIRIGGSNSVDT